MMSSGSEHKYIYIYIYVCIMCIYVCVYYVYVCVCVCVCIYIYIYIVKMKSLSCADSATPWAVAYQAPLSMGFSRQAYWSGLPFPSPGDLPDPGIKLGSPTLQADSLPSESPGKPIYVCICIKYVCLSVCMAFWNIFHVATIQFSKYVTVMNI